jgi:Heavy metal associated domain 2
LSEAQLLHAIEGRWRIRVAAIKNDADRATDLRAAICTIRGVRNISVNLVTASVTITFDSREIAPSALMARLSDVFGCPVVMRRSSDRFPSVDAVARAHDKAVRAVLTKVMEAAIRHALLAFV